MADTASHTSQCAICKHVHPFDVPSDIVAALRKGDLAIFAGAGISTEVPTVLPHTLYQEIATELGLDVRTTTVSFPELMSRYCSQANGEL